MVVALITQNVKLTEAQHNAIGAMLVKWKTKIVIAPARNLATAQIGQAGWTNIYLKPEFRPRDDTSGGEVVVFPREANESSYMVCTNIILVVPDGKPKVRTTDKFWRWAELVVDGAIYIIDPSGAVEVAGDERWQSIKDVYRANVKKEHERLRTNRKPAHSSETEIAD